MRNRVLYIPLALVLAATFALTGTTAVGRAKDSYASPCEAKQTVLRPVAADAYVSAVTPTKNFGGAQTLVAKQGDGAIFLNFVLPKEPCPVAGVYLNFWALQAAPSGLRLTLASSNWSEKTVTANNQPWTGKSPYMNVATGPVKRGLNNVLISKMNFRTHVTPLSFRVQKFSLMLRAIRQPIVIYSKESGKGPRIVYSIKEKEDIPGGNPPPTTTAAAQVPQIAAGSQPSLKVISGNGKFQVPNVVLANPGQWDYNPTAYSFQWWRCLRTDTTLVQGDCVALSDPVSYSASSSATSSYKLTAADDSHRLLVRVWASNDAGKSAYADSALTDPILGPEPGGNNGGGGGSGGGGSGGGGGGSGDTTPPVVTINMPNDHADVGGTVLIDATGTDNSGTVRGVKIAVDGSGLPVTNSGSDYRASWDTNGSPPVPDGNHQVTVMATDPAGNSTTKQITVLVDNTPPVVSFASPQDGGYVSPPSTDIRINATDAGTGVKQVDLTQDNAIPLKSFTVPPYTYHWDLTSVSFGKHTLTAKATDNAGRATTTIITVNVQNPKPTVGLTLASPTPVGSGNFVSGSLQFVATATPGTSPIASVQLMSNGMSIATDTTAPFTFTVKTNDPTNPLADSPYAFTALVTDQSGATGTSPQPVKVTVDNTSPTANINPPPANGDTVSGDVPLTASVTDAGSGPSGSVEYDVNGTPLATSTAPPNYPVVWSTTNGQYPNGQYILSITTTDLVGNVSKTSIAVTVANQNGQSITIAAVGDIAADPGDPSSGIPPSPCYGNVLNWYTNPATHTQENCQQVGIWQLLNGLSFEAFLPLGDLCYENGGSYCYAHSFNLLDAGGQAASEGGFHKWHDIEFPTIGAGHDAYGGSGYGQEFADRSCDGTPLYGPNRTYYACTLGPWYLISLDSSCTAANGSDCSQGGAQYSWLQKTLAADTNPCTLVEMHIPPFSAGEFKDDPQQRPTPGNNTLPLFRLLVQYKVDLILAAHDHFYERFDKLNFDANGNAFVDNTNGIPEIVFGTGGKNHIPSQYPVNTSHPGLLNYNPNTFGVGLLTLSPGGYSGNFIPEAGRTYTDSFSGTCH